MKKEILRKNYTKLYRDYIKQVTSDTHFTFFYCMCLRAPFGINESGEMFNSILDAAYKSK